MPACGLGPCRRGWGFFQGSLDEVRVFNRALGHLEIAALYDDSASPPPAPADVSAAAANGQVHVELGGLPGASSYVVGRSSSPGGPYSVLASLSGTGFTDAGLSERRHVLLRRVGCEFRRARALRPLEVSATPFILAAWFKADAITGVANGSPLATWPDVSGNGNDATQSTARPTARLM